MGGNCNVLWRMCGGKKSVRFALPGVDHLKPVFNTLIFTIIVPGTIAGYIPWRLHGVSPATSDTGLRVLAILLITAGAAIYLHTAFWGFAVHGRGTPAPVAPTKKLVVEGLHGYVRNPMYIGVATIVLGQAVLFRSWHIVEYLACVLVIAHFFVLFYEEPTLARQFGQDYEEYRKRVPRWIPRFRS
jgi:protein-S-isoprenylcysteine O-methyltransferase Ste14